MRLRETFRRVDRDHIEWQITVDDPMTYTKPWGPSEKRIFTLAPKSPRSEYEELREDFCVWSDSSGFFKDADTIGVGDAPARGDKERSSDGRRLGNRQYQQCGRPKTRGA